MKPFEVLYPATVNEAALLLQELGGDARIYAGGTELLVNLERGLCVPKYLVSLKRIPDLNHKRIDGDFLRVGSLSTIHDIEKPQNKIEESMGIFFQAARSIGSVQIRNWGTLGGNICQEPRCIYYNHSNFWRESLKACIRRGGDPCYLLPGSKKCVAGYCSDMAPALLALDSKTAFVDSATLREQVLGVEDFLKRRMTRLIVKEMQIPIPKGPTKGIFIKYSRKKDVGFAAMSVAIVLELEERSRRVKEARIALGGLPDFPRHISQAEDRLKGESLDERLSEDVGRLISKEVPLFSDPFLSRDNKKAIMATLIRRGLNSLA